MAITFSSPIFSFMDVPEPSETCSWSDLPCLPVFNMGDLAFQIIATVTGDDKETFNVDPVKAGLTIDCEDSGVLAVNYLAEWTLQEEGTGYAPDIWIGNFGYTSEGLFPILDTGQCFNIQLFNEAEQFRCLTQCFVKITDECFTSKFIYRCNENAFDFDYQQPDFSNRIRLPLYLHSPTNPEQEKSYSKSDGSSVKLMHRIWKDYKVKTDYLPSHVIEKFTVMTAHDSLYVGCSYSAVADYFIRMEKVDTAWMEEQSPQINVAQSVTTLRLASPRASINSNCI